MEKRTLESVLKELEEKFDCDGCCLIIGSLDGEDSEKESEKKVSKRETCDYTRGNSDNVDVAILGLDIFSKSWCMDCEETREKNEPMFRCSKCPFRVEDGVCSVKKFVVQNKPKTMKTGTAFGCMNS